MFQKEQNFLTICSVAPHMWTLPDDDDDDDDDDGGGGGGGGGVVGHHRNTSDFINAFINFLKIILIKSNNVQRYAGIYLLQNHSTCFGCPSHPSSGVHKTVTAASGTGHSI